MLDKTKRWMDISDEDFSMAEISFEHGRYLHMTFFCQQAIEKIFKGLYFETQKQTPPRKHDLLALAANCGLLDELSLERRSPNITLNRDTLRIVPVCLKPVPRSSPQKHYPKLRRY
jgi:HEPN domain-containing protein